MVKTSTLNNLASAFAGCSLIAAFRIVYDWHHPDKTTENLPPEAIEKYKNYTSLPFVYRTLLSEDEAEEAFTAAFKNIESKEHNRGFKLKTDF